MQKKAAFLIYPMFSNYEMALTLATMSMYEKEVVIFAKESTAIMCEDGMKILPDKTLEEFNIDDYDCILLSGIGGDQDSVFSVLYDDVYINFLKQFVDKDDIVIAAISISPTLLARAGLLKGKKFCVGMFEEAREELNFFEFDNQQRAPIVVEGNVITAMGMAFREFAIEIIRKLGHECRGDLWGEIKYPINPEDYIFRMES